MLFSTLILYALPISVLVAGHPVTLERRRGREEISRPPSPVTPPRQSSPHRQSNEPPRPPNTLPGQVTADAQGRPILQPLPRPGSQQWRAAEAAQQQVWFVDELDVSLTRILSAPVSEACTRTRTCPSSAAATGMYLRCGYLINSSALATETGTLAVTFSWTIECMYPHLVAFSWSHSSQQEKAEEMSIERCWLCVVDCVYL